MNLSQEQAAAAHTDSKNALCLAGAGSGKTRTLIARIAYLIEEKNVSPYEIAVMTFTRKAGTELKERLEKSIGNQAHHVTIGTLHSVALRMLQRFGETIGLHPEKITVYSTWEESVLLKDVCKELGYYGMTGWYTETKESWKGIKKKEIDAAFDLFYTRKQRNERWFIQNEIMDAFFMRCKENNALTYGMIMTSFHDLIPRISKFLKFRHILVDECQDLDLLQWAIIRATQSICDASLFAVADDSQTLYEFRGAYPDYLIRNQDKFDIYKLADNYRSDGYIVEAANKLIKHNKNRMDLEMNAIRDKKEPIMKAYDIDSSKLSQTLYVIETEGIHKNIAVLARNHFLLEKLSTLLTSAGIEHEYIGKKTALTRSEEFRKVHAFLNLAVNPFDNFSFMVAKDYLDIDRAFYKQIRLIAVQQNKSHFQVFRESNNPKWINEYFDAIDKNNFSDLIEFIYMINFEFDTLEIFGFIENYATSNYNSTAQTYLDWLAVFDVQDEISEEPAKLQLMTIHASKGLEFSMVIIAGLNEGILPSYRAKNSEKELESERRLAYVAFTRAKDFLILTSRPVDPEARIQQEPSRFIKESI